MIVFVTTDSKMNRRDEITKEIISKFPKIKTIVQNINEKKTSAILGVKNYNLYGNGYIVDYLNGLKFKISPLSFYQVNPIQTEKLYSLAIEGLNLKGNEILYDLYSGIGTISLSAAKNVKKVYGIEVVEEAVKDAKENARLNRIYNTEFVCGKVEIELPRLTQKWNRADGIIVDPPRAGLEKTAIETILEICPKKISYISCNPETLVRDLKTFSKQYEITSIQPVDMFPWTSHVECVACLKLKKTLDK